MAYTVEQLTALENSIANGSTTVKYGDKEVQYRSLNEMLRIVSIIKNELYPNAIKTNRRKFVEMGRGYETSSNESI